MFVLISKIRHRGEEGIQEAAGFMAKGFWEMSECGEAVAPTTSLVYCRLQPQSDPATWHTLRI